MLSRIALAAVLVAVPAWAKDCSRTKGSAKSECLLQNMTEAMGRLEWRVYQLQGQVSGMAKDREMIKAHNACNKSCNERYPMDWDANVCTAYPEYASEKQPVCEDSIVAKAKVRSACFDTCDKTVPNPDSLPEY